MKFNFNNKKILILKLQGMGDTILLVPLLQKIFQLYPHVRLDIAVHNNGSDEILSLFNFPIRKVIKIDSNLISYLKFLFIIIIKHYYAVILPYKSGKKENLLSFLSFSRYRIGYAYKTFRKKYYAKLFDYLINYKINVDRVEHYLELNLNLLKKISNKNFKVVRKYPMPYIREYAKKRVENFLGKKSIKEYLVFHLWAGDRNRLWDIENFKKLIKIILNNKKNIRIILVGKGIEEEENKLVIQSIKDKHIFVYKSDNIQDVLYLLKKSKIVVGNDSGIMHLASLVNTTIVSIWAYTNFYATSPVGGRVYIIRKDLKCSPCYEVFLPVKCIYRRKKCLDISVEKVWTILKKIIEKRKIEYSFELQTGAKVINI